MSKFVFCFLIFGLLSINLATAQTVRGDLEKKVSLTAQKAQAKTASNSGTIERNMTATFSLHGGKLERRHITSHGKPAEDDSVINVSATSSVSCKSYALDEHWLILAGTCMQAVQNALRTQWHNVYGDKEAFEIQLGEGFSSHMIGLITEEGLIRNDIKTHLAYNDHLMLVWRDENKYYAPFVNVLAVASPLWLQSLQLQKNILKIHTARWGTNRVFTRTIKPGTISENKFSLTEKWYDLPGTYTDPIFLINHAENEFLVGYNAAVQFEQISSDAWYSLSYTDLWFIKNTVQQNRPQDWDRIKTRLFYNDANIPCFN